MRQSLAVRWLCFTAAMAVLGAVAGGVGWLVAAAAGVEAVAWAWVLCVIPGWVVLGLEPLAPTSKQIVPVVLIGTAVRLAVAAGGALGLLALRPELPRKVFLFALLVFYLATLAWETVALARRLPLRSPSAGESVS